MAYKPTNSSVHYAIDKLWCFQDPYLAVSHMNSIILDNIMTSTACTVDCKVLVPLFSCHTNRKGCPVNFRNRMACLAFSLLSTNILPKYVKFETFFLLLQFITPFTCCVLSRCILCYDITRAVFYLPPSRVHIINILTKYL